MELKYLIDTNSVIDYLGSKLPKSGMSFMNNVVNIIPNLSVVSQIEILGFNTSPENYSILEEFMNDAVIFQLDESVIKQTIDLRKQHKIKLPDAIIAATALLHKCTIISRNTKDFQGIERLNVINPYNL